MTPAMAEQVDHIAALYEREAAARQEARRVELSPAGRQAAEVLYRAASALREERLAQLRRCGLL